MYKIRAKIAKNG